MLTRVLLHVVAATAPIDVTAHRSSGQERLRRGVPNLSLLVLLYREDGSFEQSAARRGSRKHAGVVRLAAAGGVKSATVQGDLPQRPPLAPGNLANVGNMRLEGGQRWVSVVEPVRHAARYSIREHRVPPDFLWSWLALMHFTRSSGTAHAVMSGAAYRKSGSRSGHSRGDSRCH